MIFPSREMNRIYEQILQLFNCRLTYENVNFKASLFGLSAMLDLSSIISIHETPNFSFILNKK